MKKNLLFLILFTLMLSNCAKSDKETTAEKVFSGDNLETLFESLPWSIMQNAKKGDIIATKSPALFIDFNKSVAFNGYNTAFGTFGGWDRVIISSKGETRLDTLMRRVNSK